jgi:hypothetical protein
LVFGWLYQFCPEDGDSMYLKTLASIYESTWYQNPKQDYIIKPTDDKHIQHTPLYPSACRGKNVCAWSQTHTLHAGLYCPNFAGRINSAGEFVVSLISMKTRTVRTTFGSENVYYLP